MGGVGGGKSKVGRNGEKCGEQDSQGAGKMEEKHRAIFAYLYSVVGKEQSGGKLPSMGMG